MQIVAGGFVHVAEHAVRTGKAGTLRTSAEHLASWAASYESAAPTPLPRPAIPAHGANGALTRPLPRSTQRLPRQFVVAHQRDRILEATMSLARDEGYAGITIPAIAATAQISKRTFYEHFESKDEAFMAAFDVAFGRLYTRAWTAATQQPSWPEAVRAGLRAWVAFVASEPDLARFGFCDVLTGGRAAVAKVDDAYRAFAYLLERGDDSRPEVVSHAIAGGIGAMVATWVADGRVRELPRLTPHLVYAALAPFVGDVEALQASGLAPVGGPAVPVPEPTDDRGRVLAAFAEVVRERGYDRAELADAAARAGVDAGVAQEFFEDEADCALQAIDGWSDRTFAAMSAAFAGAAGDGPLALHRALGAMLEQMASEPAMLHLAVGAVEHLGSRAVTRRTRYVSVFFDFLTPASGAHRADPVEPARGLGDDRQRDLRGAAHPRAREPHRRAARGAAPDLLPRRRTVLRRAEGRARLAAAAGGGRLIRLRATRVPEPRIRAGTSRPARSSSTAAQRSELLKLTEAQVVGGDGAPVVGGLQRVTGQCDAEVGDVEQCLRGETECRQQSLQAPRCADDAGSSKTRQRALTFRSSAVRLRPGIMGTADLFPKWPSSPS